MFLIETMKNGTLTSRICSLQNQGIVHDLVYDSDARTWRYDVVGFLCYGIRPLLFFPMSSSTEESLRPTRESPFAHNHSVCVEQALRTAERLCRERGVQLTPIRLAVLELIWSSHKAVKAYELLEQIKPLKQAAKPATIYRALDFLIEQGLIHRVESLNAFIGCNRSDYSHDQLLLICNTCHEVEELAAPDLMRALARELRNARFSPSRKTVEIQGLCGQCARLSSTDDAALCVE